MEEEISASGPRCFTVTGDGGRVATVSEISATGAATATATATTATTTTSTATTTKTAPYVPAAKPCRKT